jgi:hypothetical protein
MMEPADHCLVSRLLCYSLSESRVDLNSVKTSIGEMEKKDGEMGKKLFE